MRGMAKLPGLCEWVRAKPLEELEQEFGEQAAGAAHAIALGKPRPGHSVLGMGTFRDARSPAPPAAPPP